MTHTFDILYQLILVKMHGVLEVSSASVIR